MYNLIIIIIIMFPVERRPVTNIKYALDRQGWAVMSYDNAVRYTMGNSRVFVTNIYYY